MRIKIFWRKTKQLHQFTDKNLIHKEIKKLFDHTWDSLQFCIIHKFDRKLLEGYIYKQDFVLGNNF